MPNKVIFENLSNGWASHNLWTKYVNEVQKYPHAEFRYETYKLITYANLS